MSRQHIAYYDFLRGIAILMVVAIHTYVAGDFTTIDGIARILFRQTLNCAVPIFLALSGFFLGRKSFDGSQSVVSFWKRQIPKIYIPCMIWSLPYFIMNLRAGGAWMSVFYMLACGFSIYYFIALIIQYYLLLPFLKRHLMLNLLLSIVLSTVSISMVTYYLAIKEISLSLILYAGPFVVWLVFYMLGIYYSCKPRNYSLKISIMIVLIGFLLECIETYYLNTHFSNGVGIKLSAFIYSYGIILLILHPSVEASYRDNVLTSVIVYIGKISFAIYLTHCYFIPLVNKFVSTDFWLLKWLLVSLLTILLIVFIRSFLPKYIYKYLGFS